MILKTVTLTNMFSYHGECSLNLAPEGKGNVVVIMGRNGQGKTSFINSIKLLFMGPAKELRRQVTTAKDRMPTEKQYVCGTEGLWGILNHRARQSGENICAVRAEWVTDDKDEVLAERRWLVGDNGYEETLVVDSHEEGELHDEHAQAYLERHLPRDFIPFFFFDGEEVRELAEGNNNDTISKMELLLNIRPIENLQTGLRELRKQWRHQAADREQEAKLTSSENRLSELKATHATLEQELDDLKVDIADLESDRARVRRQLDVLRGNPQGVDEGQLKGRLALQHELQTDLLQDLATAFLGDAFLRLTPHLMDQTIAVVDQCAHGEGANQAEMLTGLKEQLPQIFSTPPYSKPQLSDTQIKFYQKRLIARLEEYEALITEESLLSLPASRARQLYKQINEYDSKKHPASRLLHQADSIRKSSQTIGELEQRLSGVEELSRSKHAELTRLVEQDNTLDDEIHQLKDKQRDIEHQVSINEREQTELINKLSDLSRKVEEAAKTRGKFQLVQRISDLLEDVKGELRKQKRNELEQKLNQHLPQLLDSNALLHSAKIDQNFMIHYLTNDGERVPTWSISAGMKQLSATALLWALKDVSGREIPLIIDTPLGRIDLHHQENLLRHYYPKAGRQVILLATDSELDNIKNTMLSPHIYRKYQLTNPSGEETHLEVMSNG